jgi:hypothetical protein
MFLKKIDQFVRVLAAVADGEGVDGLAVGAESKG